MMKKMYKKPIVEEIVTPAEAILQNVSGSSLKGTGEGGSAESNSDDHYAGAMVGKRVFF